MGEILFIQQHDRDRDDTQKGGDTIVTQTAQ